MESSNRILAFLAMLSLIFSLSSSIIVLNSISGSKTAVAEPITGMDILESKGSIDVSIGTLTAISIDINALDFGTGYVAGHCNNCTMHTPGVNETPDCCIGFSVPDQGITIENTGNQRVSLSKSISYDAGQLIGGSIPLFQYNITEKELGSCNETDGYGLWNDFAAGEYAICPSFYPDNHIDELMLHVKIRIPDDSRTGLLNSSFNFTATTLI